MVVLDMLPIKKLLDIEVDYMPEASYSSNIEIIAYREEVIKVIKEVSRSKNLSAAICYGALSLFDRFASKLKSINQKDKNVIAVVSLITTAKIESNNIYLHDLLDGDMLDLVKVHVLPTQTELLQVVGWRLRPVTPLCFTSYLSSVFYGTADVEFIDMINSLILDTCTAFSFVEFRPSVLAAAALHLTKPAEDYKNKLINCGIDLDSFHDCLALMKERA